jgi:hypothetical protein
MLGDACLWSQPILPLGITDPAALAAMQTVAREASVRPGLVELAFDDLSLPIGAGQTISALYRRSGDHNAAVIPCRSSLRNRHRFGL